MPIVYHNRSRLPPDAEAALGDSVHYCARLPDLLQRADFVVLSAPLTAGTRGMFGAAEFGAFKPGAIFVNVGRGELVDQPALVDALRAGRVAAAGLDVTAPEPLPRGHPLLAVPNCIISPHTGTATLETRAAMNGLAVDNLLAGIEGQPLPAEARARL